MSENRRVTAKWVIAEPFPIRTDEDDWARLIYRLALHSVVAFVAHEINHPLGTITNVATLLERRVRDPVFRPSEMVANLETIKLESRRAADAIKQLRILTGGLKDHTDTINCRNLLKDVVTGFRRRFAKDMVHIRVECRDHSLSLDGAPNLLQIVLYNLMVNGIESALAAKVAKPRLTLRAHALADRILIEVADNGPGIDPDIASRIFEPFVSSKPLGSGVGLAIAQDIVEWHGGKLSFECNSSRAGTNFRLAMPRRNEIRGDDVLLCSFA